MPKFTAHTEKIYSMAMAYSPKKNTVTTNADAACTMTLHMS